MFIDSYENKTKTFCECCRLDMEAEGAYNIDAISEVYAAHLEGSPDCKTWHDNLPTLESMRGIFGQAPAP